MRNKTFARRLQMVIPEPKKLPEMGLHCEYLSLSMPFDLQGQAAQ